jgi:hypothetical protein
MKFREPTKLHRKSGMWGTRRLLTRQSPKESWGWHLVDVVEEQLALEIFGNVPYGFEVVATLSGQLAQKPFLIFPG